MPTPTRPDVLLFDLGGVLVDFSGVEDLLPLLPPGARADEVKARWIACPTSNAFGTGRIGTDEFVRDFRETWQIVAAPDDFLRAYRSWTRGWLPGATALLDELRPHFRLAVLSNCNAVHWDVLCTDLHLLDHVDAAFSSHQVGTRKPDSEAFRHTLDQLGVAATQVVFFDDAAGNVAAAAALGLRGHVVDGPGAVRRALISDGLIAG
ncbi:MAG TPA: HAD-IA family hydrolase [Luteitalea sp.]|nr:HAD-IA family hydrolase [Luteitalea sp.]